MIGIAKHYLYAGCFKLSLGFLRRLGGDGHEGRCFDRSMYGVNPAGSCGSIDVEKLKAECHLGIIRRTGVLPVQTGKKGTGQFAGTAQGRCEIVPSPFSPARRRSCVISPKLPQLQLSTSRRRSATIDPRAGKKGRGQFVGTAQGCCAQIVPVPFFRFEIRGSVHPTRCRHCRRLRSPRKCGWSRSTCPT